MICISASIKFREKIIEVSKKLNQLGINHILPIMDLPKEAESSEMIPSLVFNHFKKIDQADVLLVVNPGGYIGNSVKVEIGYAKGRGKEIFFLEKTGLDELDCLADMFIKIEDFGSHLGKLKYV